MRTYIVGPPSAIAPFNHLTDDTSLREACRPAEVFESIALVPPWAVRAYLTDLTDADLLAESHRWLNQRRDPQGRDEPSSAFLREFAAAQVDKLLLEVRRRAPPRRRSRQSHRSFDVAAIKARVSLVEIVAHDGIELHRTGQRYRANCPFHPDDTPSLVLYPDQRFHCFGCGKSGDAITWMMERRGLTFAAALRTLAGEATHAA